MKSLLAPIALAALLASTGCGPVACDDAAYASVTVTVQSEAVPEVVPEVSWRRAGDTDWEACEDFGDGSYACAWEVAGTLEILVTAEDHEEVMETVEVAEDVCHVITELLDVDLVLEMT